MSHINPVDSPHTPDSRPAAAPDSRSATDPDSPPGAAPDSPLATAHDSRSATTLNSPAAPDFPSAAPNDSPTVTSPDTPGAIASDSPLPATWSSRPEDTTPTGANDSALSATATSPGPAGKDKQPSSLGTSRSQLAAAGDFPSYAGGPLADHVGDPSSSFSCRVLATNLSSGNSIPELPKKVSFSQAGSGRLRSLLDHMVTLPRGGIDTGFYHKITEQVLFLFYPKNCAKCGQNMTGTISTRPYAIRCTRCFAQKSRLSQTPLHCMRLPMWMFGWVFHEAFQRAPNVLTSMEIHKRLGISYKSALNLKRRFQLFASQQQKPIRALFYEYLEAEHYELPVSRKKDLTDFMKQRRAPVHIDTMALFSASQRTNKGRKRNKHRGQTASIYMNDSLGGRQVGSLFQTIALKNGPAFLTSVPNQKRETLGPVLSDHIPSRSPVFSDEGYTWYVNPNHRMVNHNAKSRDKRYRLARNRWSKNGVHCQVAEGTQSVFKTAMRNYRYYRPEYSQLYANEFSFLKNSAWFGLFAIARKARERANECGESKGVLSGCSKLAA